MPFPRTTSLLQPTHGRDDERTERFLRLAERTRIIAWEFDRNTHQFTYVSSNAVGVFGYPMADWYRPRFWFDHVHTEDRAKAREFTLAHSNRGENHEFEYRMIAADGRVVWIRDHVMVEMVDGKPSKLSGVMIDITDRKQAEVALRESGERLHAIAEHVPGVVFAYDIIPGQPRRLVYLGPGLDELIGPRHAARVAACYDTIFDLIHPDDRPGLASVAEMGARTGARVDRELRLRTESGEYVWVRTISRAIVRGGEPVRWQGVIIDVTDQKRAEAALREKDRTLRTLLNNLPGMAYRCRNDAARTLEFASDGGTELTGFTPTELMQNRVTLDADLIHPDDRQRVREEVQGAIGDQESWQLTYRIRHADASTRWVWEQGAAVRGDCGRLLALEGFIIDITEQHAIEAALRRTNACIELAAIPAFWVRADGSFARVNFAACASLGYSRSDFDRLRVWDIAPDGSEASWAAEWQQACESRSLSMRTRHVTKDGRVFPVELTANHVEFEGEQYIFAFARDVTAIVEAEASLRESERLMREAQAISHVGSYYWKTDANSLDWSDEMYRIHGRSPESGRMTREEYAACVHPDDREALFAATRRTVEQGTPFQQEYRINRSDGACRWLSARTRAVRDAAGTILALEGTCQDITERRNIEDALRERESRLALVLEQTPAVFWTTDMELRFTASTGAGLIGMGLRPDQVIGLTLQEYFGSTDESFEPIARHRQALAGQSAEYDTDWAGRTFHTRVEPLHDDGGRITGTVGIAHDVTETRRFERELRRKGEVEHLLRGELDHRVRNNLTSLLSVIDMTRRSARDVAGFAEAISGRVRAMASVHSLLSQARWRRVDFRGLLTTLLQSDPHPQVQLTGPFVQLPSHQTSSMAMVIHELVTNSRKHGALSTADGRISIEWSIAEQATGGRWLEVNWREAGAPMRHQASTEGIGLALIQGLVRDDLRGSVELTFPADGAVHTIRLPLPSVTERSATDSPMTDRSPA